MTLLYADPSALVRAYFADEAEHATLRQRLLFGDDPVLMSEIGRLEVASAMMAAARAGRIAEGSRLVARFEADCAPGGPLALLGFRPEAIIPRAARLILDHPVAALDALHLAVALEDGLQIADGEELILVTRDVSQSEVAISLGFQVA